MTRDLRTLTSNSDVREHWARAWSGIFQNSWGYKRMEGSSSRSGRDRGAAVEVDTVGEQQLKRSQSGSSSRSGRNRGAVEGLKRMQAASSARNRSAAGEADTIGEQQLKRMRIGEQQLKRTRIGSSSSAQRAVRCRITRAGERHVTASYGEMQST